MVFLAAIARFVCTSWSVVAATLVLSAGLTGQVIDFESNGLHYQALTRNSVTVTLNDLTKVGTVIDAAAQAGANDVSGIQFTLRQDRQAHDRALSEATQEAVSKAKVIAQALGGRVVRILEVQEEGFQQRPPVPFYAGEVTMAKAGVATPIEVGALDITSKVQLIAEVEM